eukprot:gene9168-biopygen7346
MSVGATVGDLAHAVEEQYSQKGELAFAGTALCDPSATLADLGTVKGCTSMGIGAEAEVEMRSRARFKRIRIRAVKIQSQWVVFRWQLLGPSGEDLTTDSKRLRASNQQVDAAQCVLLRDEPQTDDIPAAALTKSTVASPPTSEAQNPESYRILFTTREWGVQHNLVPRDPELLKCDLKYTLWAG